MYTRDELGFGRRLPSQDGRVVGDDDDDDGFPLREGSSPGGIAPPEGKSAPAQVPPRGGGASSRKSSSSFFLGQNDLYTRRWAPKVGWVEHNPPGCAWGPMHALVSCAHQVASLRWLFAPVFLIYSIKNPREVSAHLELCRIGILT